MLVGEHIFLRKLLLSDVGVILKWENNPENWKISGTTKAFTALEIETFVSQPQDLKVNQQFRYVICLNDSKNPIGTLDLFEFDEQNKSVGIGVLIAEKVHRNKGCASEALALVIKYCRNELNLVNLFCNIQKDNATSIRLFEKNGFQFIQEKELFGKPVNYYELKL